MLRPRVATSLSVAASAFLALTTLFSPAAHAVLTLSLDDGGGPTVVTDVDGDGRVAFSGTLTNFTVESASGVSKPFLIGAPSLIGLNSQNTSTRAGTIVIELSDTDFTTSTGYLRSLFSGITEGLTTYEAFVDPANGNPFLGTLIGSGSADKTEFSNSIKLVTDLTSGAPYSIGIRLTIKHGLGPKLTNAGSTVRIPEPETLGMLGTGLMLAGLLLKRRRRRDS